MTRAKAGRPWWQWVLIALLAIAVIAAIWLAFNFAHLKAQAELGARYGARVVCSCRYVEGRDMQSCLTDFEPGMEIVSVADEPGAERVIGTVTLLAKAAAERRGASGCVLLNDEEMAAVD